MTERAVQQDMTDSKAIIAIMETENSTTDSVSSPSGSGNIRAAMEMEIVIRLNEDEKGCVSGENRDVIHSDMVSKVLEDEVKVKVKEVDDERHLSCVVDVKRDDGERQHGENSDCEQACRICHLSCDQSAEGTSTERELIKLGCGCKDELGTAHSYCAEAWFKLRGNRFCEICGEMAKNVRGVGDNRFMEEWNGRRSRGNGFQLSERRVECWGGQPLCNVLMAFLVMGFVLPWFIRVSMF